MRKYYEVRCEVMSRNPELACYGDNPTLSVMRFDHPQDGADACRAFVAGFSDSDIPDKYRQWYSAADLPRAFMVKRVGMKPIQPVLSVFRDLQGNIRETRYR